MSASSATKNTEILTQEVLAQLDEVIHKAPCPGLAVDEKKEFFEDLLGYYTLSDQHKRRGHLPGR